MVAERLVFGASPPLRLWLELPPCDDGPSRIPLGVSSSTTLAGLRARAADILGAKYLDAYLSVDGKRIEDEETTVGAVAVPDSRVTVHPRLRGGMVGV